MNEKRAIPSKLIQVFRGFFRATNPQESVSDQTTNSSEIVYRPPEIISTVGDSLIKSTRNRTVTTKKKSLKPIIHNVKKIIEVYKEDTYLEFYDELFSNLYKLPLNILEVGVYKGGSLLMFAHYFENARLMGIDINPPDQEFFDKVKNSDLKNRVSVEIGSQDDIGFLEETITSWFRNKYLDIVIDDASHLYEQTKSTFDYIFYHQLGSGGIYIIEDWGAGYWPKWPDGNPDGMHGLPRLVKELVDDVALRDRSLLYEGESALPVTDELQSPIEKMIVAPSIIVLFKA
jgi:SAM-dependent methyltransferase